MKWIDAPWIELLRIALEVAATVAFALSGVMMAARKRFDAVGVCVVAFVSAFGGGTLRDLLLDQRPFFWVRHTEFVWGILLLTVTAPLVLRARRHQLVDWIMEIADAAGLGLFAISGTSLAVVAGMPPVISVLMGAITAVFGGVLRDVLCNEVPQAFSDHRPYALCAFAGGWVDVALRQVQAPDWAPLLACVMVTAGLRVLALWRNWQLPAWRV